MKFAMKSSERSVLVVRESVSSREELSAWANVVARSGSAMKAFYRGVQYTGSSVLARWSTYVL